MTEPLAVPSGRSVIGARGLTRRFGRGPNAVEALKDVDLDVAAGELLMIMGPSGGGKSTLLNLIGGIDRPTSGSLSVAGVDLAAASQRDLDRFRSERVGFVFQFFNLLATATARDNVALALLARGAPWRTARDEATTLLDLVGLADRALHRPAQLSGGEQQRVAIARAIAGQPEVILADEPTGDVDSVTATQLMDLMAGLNRDLGTTFIVVTHNEDLAHYATRRCRLVDGRIQTGSQ